MKKIIIITLIVLIIFGLGGYFIFARGKKQVKPVVSTPTPVEEETLPTISDKELIVDLTPRADRKAVFLKITKFPKGTTMIEYEMTYDTNGVERGVMGTINIKSDDELINREILLGSCSKNVCVYDKNVEKIKLVLRIETKEGTKSWSKEFSLTDSQ